MLNDPNQLNEPLGYICPSCRSELSGQYRPFCGECGRPMLPARKLQLIGLTFYPRRYGSGVGGIDDMTAVVNAIGASQYWLEEYHPTFRTAKIRIEGNGKQQPTHDLFCTGTLRMELPIDNGWFGVIAIKQLADETTELSDTENQVYVRAGSVKLYPVTDV